MREYLIIYQELASSGLDVPIMESKYFIYRINYLIKDNDFYARVYLINSQIDDIVPTQLTFRVTVAEKTTHFTTTSLYNVEEYSNNKNIFGCLIKLSDIYDENNIHIQIESYIANDSFTILEEEQVKLTLDKPIEIPDLLQESYLKSIGLRIYPQFLNSEFWLCQCGSINLKEICKRCRKPKSQLFEFTSIPEFIFNNELNNSYVLNPKLSFDKNLEIKFEELAKLKIDFQNFISNEELNNMESIYNSKQKSLIQEYDESKWILESKLSFDENLSRIKNNMQMNDESIKLILNEEKVSELYNSYKSNKKKKNIILVSILSISALVTIIFLFMNFYGFKYLNYSSGKKLYLLADYQGAIEKLSNLNGYRNVDDIIYDARFQLAKMKFDSEPDQSISDLSELAPFPLNEQTSNFLEQVYQIGIQRFDDKKFKQSSEFFKLIENYKDAPAFYIESQYQYAISMLSKDGYELAIPQSILESLKNISYKDSENLYLDVTYNLAVSLYHKGHEAEAAYAEFRKVPNYKDTKLFLDYLDIKSNGWFAEISFSNEEDLPIKKDEKVVKNNKLIWLNVSLTSDKKMPSGDIKIEIDFGNGTSETITEYYRFTEKQQSHTSFNYYYYPEAGVPTGTMAVEVWDVNTNKLIAKNSILVK